MTVIPIELSQEDPYYTNNINSNITLKRHQLTALYKCIELENECIQGLDNNYEKVVSNIGMLCDDVGSGKSYIILALLNTNPVPLNSFHKQSVHGVYDSLHVVYKKDKQVQLNTNIIVCSFSLISQWEVYIKTFNPKTSYTKVNTNVSMEKYFREYNSGNCDILLLSSTFYRHVEKFMTSKEISVKRVIFDEADSTSVPGAKQIIASFYWFVTANYKNCLNPYLKYRYNMSISEINMMNSTTSGVNQNMFIKNLFGSLVRSLNYRDYKSIMNKLIVKNDLKYIRQSFNLPDIISNYIECCDFISDIISSVSSNQNIIKAVNAGDIQNAMSIINNGNITDETNIIQTLIQDLNNKITNCLHKIEYHNNIVVSNVENNNKRIQALKEEELDLRNKIECVKDRVMNSRLCSICYQEPTNRSIMKCCSNVFCFECICRWFRIKSDCPLCKKNIMSIKDEIMVVKDTENDNMTTKKYKKIEVIEKLLEKIICPTSKILIFSEYDRSFVEIITILEKLGIKYGFLKGTSLMSNLNKYRNEDTNVLLINSKAFGSGINLENTTDIVMFHSFFEDIEKQVIGRAQRPGRSSSLKVWYLWNTNEVNENKNNKKHVNEYNL